MEDREFINDPVLGELVYKEKLDRWYGEIDDSKLRVSINSRPDTESNIKIIRNFVEWYSLTRNFLNKKIVFELFNHDIVQGEFFIENSRNLAEKDYEKEHSILESKIENSLKLHEVNSYDNKLIVWFAAGEYTGGHTIKTALNEKYEVEYLEKL